MTTAFAKSSSWPAPPEATIGTSTAARTARSISRSKPACVPSASTDVRRISPAPAAAAAAAHAVTDRSVGTPSSVRHHAHHGEAARVADALSVDRDDDALRPELLGEPRDQGRVLDRGGVHDDAVGSGAEKRVRVLHRAHAAADGEGNREHLGHASRRAPRASRASRARPRCRGRPARRPPRPRSARRPRPDRPRRAGFRKRRPSRRGRSRRRGTG